MQNLNEGLLFDPALSAEIKDRFYYVDADPEFGQRLFFENSGGSLRLKASVEAQAKYQAFPDCPERSFPRAQKSAAARHRRHYAHRFRRIGRRAHLGDDCLAGDVPDRRRHPGKLPRQERGHVRARAPVGI